LDHGHNPTKCSRNALTVTDCCKKNFMWVYTYDPLAIQLHFLNSMHSSIPPASLCMSSNFEAWIIQLIDSYDWRDWQWTSQMGEHTIMYLLTQKTHHTHNCTAASNINRANAISTLKQNTSKKTVCALCGKYHVNIKEKNRKQQNIFITT